MFKSYSSESHFPHEATSPYKNKQDLMLAPQCLMVCKFGFAVTLDSFLYVYNIYNDNILYYFWLRDIICLLIGY